MLITFEKAAEMIRAGKLLHISASEKLLKNLPKGNWIGGSTKYFMAGEGIVSDELIFVTEFAYKNFSIKSYDTSSIEEITGDAFDEGFSLLILPYESEVCKSYAENAAGYKDMFIKKIAGWVCCGESTVTINGTTGEAFSDRGVALHMETPGENASINIINIFEQNPSSPVITFTEEGFSVRNCIVDGEEVNFADYIEKNNLDTKLPLVADYSGNGINISIESVKDGVVSFYSSITFGTKYQFAKPVTDYVKEFRIRLEKHKNTNFIFSCNCFLNFLYGELEGKSIDVFSGPITYGEIAYQLLNQTLVYIAVSPTP